VPERHTTGASRARVPIEAGFFRIPADPSEPPRLLGSRCRRCGEVFFPRREACAQCLARELDGVELGTRGTLYTWTWVHFPLFNSRRTDDAGYGVGQIDLPEGPRVQAVLSGGPDAFRVGMQMEIELETLRENKQGQEVVIYRFRPAPAGDPDPAEAAGR
jgi:uncharacterized OB-fold protein